MKTSPLAVTHVNETQLDAELPRHGPNCGRLSISTDTLISRSSTTRVTFGAISFSNSSHRPASVIVTWPTSIILAPVLIASRRIVMMPGPN